MITNKKNIYYLLIIIFFLGTSRTYSADLSESISLNIKEILQNRANLECFIASNCNIQFLINIYTSNNYKPLWSENGKISQNAHNLLNFIKKSYEDGLNPNHYNVKEITEILKNLENKPLPLAYASLDIYLTAAFLDITSHLISGRINPRFVHDSWSMKREMVDTSFILLDTINSQKNISEVLQGFIPKNKSYQGLKNYLHKYRELEQTNGWEKLGDTPKLERGMTHEKVVVLRNILYKMGDYSGKNLVSPYFDGDLENAVKKFQIRHGLDPDGKVGPQTNKALNVSVRDRIKQIELNMESWRWLPKDFGKRYLIINIANFELVVYEDDKKIMSMKTIVGRPYRMTPVFSSEINQIVLNPPWYVPRTIAVNDFLPDLRRNVDVISQKRLRVYVRGKNGPIEVDPYKIDWAHIDKRNFNYYFVQPPGDFNSLGKIKFNLPNEYDVYLHGTPQKNLFQKNKRDFSSGCVRLEHPLELALYLLKDNSNWDREKIEKILERNQTTFINLQNPLTVYFIYQTAWVDENNDIHFRDDIYQREALLEKLLQNYRFNVKEQKMVNLVNQKEGRKVD